MNELVTDWSKLIIKFCFVKNSSHAIASLFVKKKMIISLGDFWKDIRFEYGVLSIFVNLNGVSTY